MPHESVIGIDVGGTKITAARYVLSSWKLDAEETVATEAAQGFASVLDRVAALVEKLRTPETSGIGIGLPGLIEQPSGKILHMHNIPGADGADAKQFFSKRFGVDVAIENDAHCFALAEAVHGVGKGKPVVIGVTLGTGVGGGIVVDGKIVHGHHGFAGEIGHMLLVPGKAPFGAGDRRGDSEEFLSGTALRSRAEAKEQPSAILTHAANHALRERFTEELAWFCVNLTYCLDPSIIVFGGGLGRSLDSLLPDVTVAMRRWMLPHTPMPELAIAKRKDAGTLGAALLCK